MVTKTSNGLKPQKTALSLHADDAGLSSRANQAILDLAKAGRLSSLSVIANGPCTADFAKAYHQIAAGKISPPAVFLHFDLVEFKPLVIEMTRRRFGGKTNLAWQVVFTGLDKAAAKSELEAQLDKLESYGLKVIGIDSHQHAHALSPVAETVYQTAARRQLVYRSFGLMRCQSLRGKLKLNLFKLAARLSNWRHNQTLSLPVTWSPTSWQPFVVASWEKINHRNIKPDELIVCHPGTDYDHDFKA